MSVLARKRGLSAKEFFKKALDIREQVFIMAHKEKIVPKRKGCVTFGLRAVNRRPASDGGRCLHGGVLDVPRRFMPLAHADGRTIQSDPCGAHS